MKEYLKPKTSGFSDFSKPIVFGSITGTAIIFISLILLALIFSFGEFSASTVSLFSSFATVLGAFLGGFIAAKKSGKKGLFTGLLTGLAMFFVFFIISLAVIKSTPSITTLIKLAVFLSSGGVGGIIGVGTKARKFK